MTDFRFALSIRMGFIHLMRDTESTFCPFCGQENSLTIDTSVAFQKFTTDCEVCCRPFEVSVECEEGEIVSVATDGN